jgi:hypothetical protein
MLFFLETARSTHYVYTTCMQEQYWAHRSGYKHTVRVIRSINMTSCCKRNISSILVQSFGHEWLFIRTYRIYSNLFLAFNSLTFSVG